MGSDSLRIERISERARFQELRDTWNRLGPGGEVPSLALTHEWFSCWLDAFHNSGKLMILALFDGDELVGVAPLQIVRSTYRGIPSRQLRFLLNRHGPRCCFLLREGYEAGVQVLFDEALRLPDWDLLMWDRIPHGSYLHTFCSDLKESGRQSFLFRESLQSPCLTISGPWETFFQARSRNFKRSLRKKEDGLSALGTVTIDHITDSPAALAIMPGLFAIGEKSWKTRHLRAIGSRPDSRRFYTLLAERLGQLGELSIWVMRIDGRPAAFEFHIVRGRKVQALRAEFDEAFRALGVGSVLDKSIVRELFLRGFERYEMGGDPDFYKLRWTNDIAHHSEIVFFGKSPAGVLLRMIENRLVPPLKVLLKRRPPVAAPAV